MRLLIIGGSVFLGRHLVSQALAAGDRVTVLNRGNNNLPEQMRVEKLVADRENALDLLSGRSFEAVVDTCGYLPSIVHKSAVTLKDSIGTYVFISSVSAYGEFSAIGMTEKEPVRTTPPGEQGDYGTLKSDCETVVTKLIPTKALIIRPGLIVGPYDASDRFTYWPARVAGGGTVLAPGRPDRAIQFLDVRDLATWILKLAREQVSGIFNATGPREQSTMKGLLDACQQSVGGGCKFLWIADQALLKAGIEPWTDLPLWLPDSNQSFAGFMRLDCSKAFASGLTTRPLFETIVDTLAWDRTRDPAMLRKAGLSRERESELLRQLGM